MRNVTNVRIGIESVYEALLVEPFLIMPLTHFPKVRHMELSITQKALFHEGLSISHFFKLLSDRFGLIPRPVSVVSSGPMTWELLASGRKAMEEDEDAAYEITTRDFAPIRLLLATDLLMTIMEIHRLVEMGFSETMNDWDDDNHDRVDYDELKELDMEKLFDEGDKNTPRASGDPKIQGEANDAEDEDAPGSPRNHDEENAPPESDNESNHADEQDGGKGQDETEGAGKAVDDGSEDRSEDSGDDDKDDEFRAEEVRQDDSDEVLS
jgi:hypothetical protein